MYCAFTRFHRNCKWQHNCKYKYVCRNLCRYILKKCLFNSFENTACRFRLCFCIKNNFNEFNRKKFLIEILTGFIDRQFHNIFEGKHIFLGIAQEQKYMSVKNFYLPDSH